MQKVNMSGNTTLSQKRYSTLPRNCWTATLALLVSSFISITSHAAPIHDAVLANDLAAVQKLITEQADVNELDRLGFSPLLLARLQDYTEIAVALNQAGATSQVNAIAETAQHELWGLGYTQEIPDGILGTNTRNALRDFQTDQGLEITGRINVPTMLKLDLLALLRMQTYLKELGFYSGALDGLRGAKSSDAINAAKLQFNITNNKLLSYQLFDALAKTTGNSPITKPAAVPRPTVAPPLDAATNEQGTSTITAATEPETPILSKKFIKNAQEKLTWLGYDTNGADGFIGPGTSAAVKNFASTSGLAPGKQMDDAYMAVLDNAVNVRVQTYLNDLNYPAGPADGFLGEKTVEAIKKYQADNQLAGDGDLNDETLAKLKTAAEKANAGDPSGLNKAIIINIQQKLNWLGFNTRGVDGNVGNGTLEAIKQFAESVDIKDPDVRDSALIGALDHAVAKKVQGALTELKYSPGPADGLMGGQTRNAIRQYEKKSNLAQTGDISGALLTKLTASLKERPVRVDRATIREIQAKLTTMGFDTKGIDGKMGGQTTVAIKDFQKFAGMKIDGKVTKELMAKIDRTLLNPPKRKAKLTRDQMINMQRSLNSLGYKVGVPDGKAGTKTQAALKRFVANEKLNVSSEPNRLLLSILLAKAAPKIADIRQSGGQKAPKTSGGSGIKSSRSGSSVGATEVTGRIRFHKSGGQLLGCSIAGVQVSAKWCRTFTHIKKTKNCKLSVRSNGQPLYIRCR